MGIETKTVACLNRMDMWIGRQVLFNSLKKLKQGLEGRQCKDSSRSREMPTVLLLWAAFLRKRINIKL